MGPENDALAKCNSGKHMAIWGIHVKFLGCRCDSSFENIRSIRDRKFQFESIQDQECPRSLDQQTMMNYDYLKVKLDGTDTKSQVSEGSL